MIADHAGQTGGERSRKGTDWRGLLLRSFLAGVGSQLARELVRRVTR